MTVTVPYETITNPINFAKYQIFKPEKDSKCQKRLKISQIKKAKREKRKAKKGLKKVDLLDHKVKIKAIKSNISLKYKEIEVKSEYNPVAKLEGVGKT